jgi:hypothetical protein
MIEVFEGQSDSPKWLFIKDCDVKGTKDTWIRFHKNTGMTELIKFKFEQRKFLLVQFTQPEEMPEAVNIINNWGVLK